MRPVRAILPCLLAFAGALAIVSCGSAMEPVVSLPVSSLQVTVSVSPAWIDKSDPPDSVVARLRVINPHEFAVRVLPESSSLANGDPFIGSGLRYTFEWRVRGELHGSSEWTMFPTAFFLQPGEGLLFTSVIRPEPRGWGPEITVDLISSIQGIELPVRTVRVRDHGPCIASAQSPGRPCSRP